MKYTAIRSEGGLLPYDLLDEILEEAAPGQKAPDFGLPKGRRVSDEVQRVWLDAQELWSRFKVGREKLTDKDPHGTTLTRDRWIGPILTDPVRLSYDLHFQSSALVLGGLTFAISHRAGEPHDSPPVHIEGCGIELDKRPQKYRVSPQAMVQEFLNRNESLLWGVVTNGLRFRLLRDSVRTARPTYLEFDLETILEGGHYNEFVLFYRLCHRTRLPQAGRPSEDCWLEKYYQLSVEKGGRVRDNLRDGVEEALKVLGTGFLCHPENTTLLEQFDSGKLNADQYHRQLLLLVYRLLFLTVAEDRHLVISIGESAVRNQAIYQDNYSIGKLRERAEGLLEDSGFSDLWVGLTQTFKLFADSNDTNPLGIPPLNGDLFSHTTIPDLETAQISNLDLLKAIRWLMFYRERNIRQRVNYAALDVEELGSVYESLLDFRPIVSKEADGRKFDLGVGSERKTTGSYYTRPELVRELIQSALVPVLDERLAEVEKQVKGQPAETIRNAKVKAIQGISVCDPACGSGHFLLEAARRLGKELARIRVGEDEPTPEQFHVAVRDVISHCIYGVDQNPLAVDLCKLALWIEGHWSGKPLSFLDHRIRCGNSLVGVLDPAIMAEGIPDDAFNAVTGDDKKVAAAYKKRNRVEKALGQKRLEFEQSPAEHSEEYAELFGIGLDFPEDKPSDVRKKAELFAKARGGVDWWHDFTAANLWTASFFVPLTKLDDPLVPTQDTFLSYLLHRQNRPQMTGTANSLGGELRFFHWHLEFPEVFQRGGFDSILGNPPWEKIKLQEREFFAAKAPHIANAQTAALRTKMIQALATSANLEERQLHTEYEKSLRQQEGANKFGRQSGRYPLTGTGDINTYALFAELVANLISSNGRCGVILKTGIATDDTTKDFFAALVSNRRIVSLIDFANKRGLFSAVVANERFCLVTIAGPQNGPEAFLVSVLNETVEQTKEVERRYTLTAADVMRINPNTRTCPLFYGRTDAQVCMKIYESNPVMVNESVQPTLNPWNLDYYTMFHMTNDSHLFRDKETLVADEFTLEANVFSKGAESFLPLYEGKLFNLYDYRYGTFEGVSRSDRFGIKAEPNHPDDSRKSDPQFEIEPRYWVNASAVSDECERRKIPTEAFFVFRDICRAFTDSRTARGTLVPMCAAGNKAPLLIFKDHDALSRAKKMVLFACLFSSFSFDFVVRQKLATASLNRFILIQIAVPGPEAFSRLVKLDGNQTTVGELVVNRAPILLCNTKAMLPFFDKLGVQSATVWDAQKRHETMSLIDALMALSYGLSRDEYAYILGRFPILEGQEVNKFGEFRSKRLCLEAWDRLTLV